MKAKTKRWKPEWSEKFYYITHCDYFFIDDSYWWEEKFNRKSYREHNCFRTKSEANAKLKEIKKILRGEK